MDIGCPNCKQHFRVPDSAAGRKARCGACKAVFIVPQSNPATRACPGCGAALVADAIICHRCGMNLRTGQESMQDEGAREADADEEEEPSLPIRFIVFIGEWVPGLFRLKPLIGAIILAPIGFAIMGMAAFFAAIGVIFAAFSIGAMGVLAYGQALAMIISGETSLLNDSLADFRSNQWLLFIVLLFAPFGVIALIVKHYVGQ